MRLTKRGERVALAAAVIGGLTLGMTAQIWNPYTRHLDKQAAQCRMIVLSEDTTGLGDDSDVQDLLADGWYGDPTDHLEALYSPECAK